MKKIIKKLFNALGFYIGKINVSNTPAYQTVLALKAHNINLVFDVGANVGQFAQELRRFGYLGKIVSFEPLPNAYETLIKRAESDDAWIVHPRCAIGRHDGEVEINVAANSVSSSILPMLNKHLGAAPESRYTHKEKVPLITIDGIYNQYCKKDDNVFIKVDTQGYEWDVLKGAEHGLASCIGVALELSLVPLYEGQKLLSDFDSLLNEAELRMYSIQPCFTDSRTGQTLQIDGLFFKSTA